MFNELMNKVVGPISDSLVIVLEDLEKAKEYIDRMIENLLDEEETDNE